MSKFPRLASATTGRTFFFALFGLLHLGFLAGCASTPGADENIKLLLIGNSFTNNTVAFLPQFARNDGRPLTLFPAVLGGTVLENHAAAARAYAADPTAPAGRVYRQGQQQFSLVEALKSQQWNYVTIQESLGRANRRDASIESLKVLVDLVRTYAPQAQILLFEPWSSREQKSPVPDGRTSSRISYEQIHAESLRLAAKFDLKLLPIGTAFQNARATPLWQIKTPDPDFDYENPKEGKLPDQTGSLINGWSWNHGSSNDPTPRMVMDNLHANHAGSYLAGAVLYEMISGTDIRKNSLSVNDVSSSRLKSLRELAHAAVIESQVPVPPPAAVPAATP